MDLIAIKSNEEIYLDQPPFDKVGKIQVFKDVIRIILNDNLLSNDPQPKKDRKNRKESQRLNESLGTDPEPDLQREKHTE
jgi:hypothetical protein